MISPPEPSEVGGKLSAAVVPRPSGGRPLVPEPGAGVVTAPAEPRMPDTMLSRKFEPSRSTQTVKSGAWPAARTVAWMCSATAARSAVSLSKWTVTGVPPPMTTSITLPPIASLPSVKVIGLPRNPSAATAAISPAPPPIALRSRSISVEPSSITLTTYCPESLSVETPVKVSMALNSPSTSMPTSSV